MEWINVKDKQPPFHKEILFYVDDQSAVMKGAFYRASYKFRAYGKHTEASFYKDEIKYWMPLPEPPEQEQRNQEIRDWRKEEAESDNI